MLRKISVIYLFLLVNVSSNLHAQSGDPYCNPSAPEIHECKFASITQESPEVDRNYGSNGCKCDKNGNCTYKCLYKCEQPTLYPIIKGDEKCENPRQGPGLPPCEWRWTSEQLCDSSREYTHEIIISGVTERTCPKIISGALKSECNVNIVNACKPKIVHRTCMAVLSTVPIGGEGGGSTGGDLW